MTASTVPPPLYQNESVKVEAARPALCTTGVDISLKRFKAFAQLNKNQFSDIWKARYIAESHIHEAGYSQYLCYAQLEPSASPIWQVVAYSNLPHKIDNGVTRKVYSIWHQSKLLFRTFFPVRNQRKVSPRKGSHIGDSLDTKRNNLGRQKTGRGALTSSEVIQNQMIAPNTVSSNENEILVLYNYAPLRTGGEQLHFLLIPHPAKPAKNFLELDKEQYVNVLALAQKIALFADDEIKEEIVVHLFDKTGEMAGQTQPLFHAHLIITKKGREQIGGRLAMFFRMLVPPSPLPKEELARRVAYYKSSLGVFLAQQV